MHLGGGIQVSKHAIERWRERVDPAANDETALAAILRHEKIIELAVKFNCSSIILGCGSRLKLIGNTVTTCIGPNKRRRAA
jgi:hypothetical protein